MLRQGTTNRNNQSPTQHALSTSVASAQKMGRIQKQKSRRFSRMTSIIFFALLFGMFLIMGSVCLYEYTFQARALISTAVDADERVFSKVNDNIENEAAAASDQKAIVGNEDDSPTFVFHVGPTKTGTTTIQTALSLLNIQGMLAKDNFVYVPRRIIPRIEPCIQKLSIANCSEPCQEEAKASKLCFYYRKADAIISKARENRQNVVYSYEGDVSFEMEKAFQELINGFNVKAVVSYRRYFQWLPSAYNSRYKPDEDRPGRKTLNVWPGSDGGETIPTLGNALEKIFLESDRIANLEGHSFRRLEEISTTYKNVEVINIHDKGKPGLLHDFVCNVMQARSSCEEIINGDRLSNLQENPTSESLRHDQIAIAAYQNGIIDSKKFTRPEVREAIRQHEDELGYTSLNNYPLTCLSRSQIAKLLDNSLQHEKQMLPEFFTASAGEDVLRADFDTPKAQLSFCGVDAEKVINDEAWRGFFEKLEK